jgi:hypothetical protein
MKNKNLPGPKRRLHRLGPLASFAGVTASAGATAAGLVVVASEKWQAASSLRVVVVVMSWQTCCHVSVRHLPDSDRARTYKLFKSEYYSSISNHISSTSHKYIL